LFLAFFVDAQKLVSVVEGSKLAEDIYTINAAVIDGGIRKRDVVFGSSYNFVAMWTSATQGANVNSNSGFQFGMTQSAGTSSLTQLPMTKMDGVFYNYTSANYNVIYSSLSMNDGSEMFPNGTSATQVLLSLGTPPYAPTPIAYNGQYSYISCQAVFLKGRTAIFAVQAQPSSTLLAALFKINGPSIFGRGINQVIVNLVISPN